MRWLQFILSHSIFISFCAAALSYQTLQLSGHPVDIYLLAFIFFATVCSYNAYWMISKYSFGTIKRISRFLVSQPGHWILILVSIAGMLWCFFQLDLVLYNLAIAFVLMGMYALPLLPIPQLSKARKAGFIKTILLALAWAHVTTLVPLQKPFTEMNGAEWLLMANRFCFMLLLCIIFDRRDAAVDKIRGLHSLATDISDRTLNLLVLFIFILNTAILIYSRYEFLERGTFIALQSILVITILTYAWSKRDRGYVFYYFLVDGLMLFSALATYIGGIK